jgi:predicted nucleic acid-binding protein
VRRGIDSNVLVYAHMPGLPGHERVAAFLREQLNDHEVKLALTPLILHEFVHVVTDARRFDPPVSMSEARAVAGLYLERSNVECLAVDEASLRIAFHLIERHQLGRRRIADALFAAVLLTRGVAEIITCNPSDYRVIDELTVVDPRGGSPPVV